MTTSDPDPAYVLGYSRFLDELRDDPRVVGAILAGSRSRGLEGAQSDTDAYIIVDDGVSGRQVTALRQSLERRHADLRVDLSNKSLQTMTEFGHYAAIGSPHAWDRYNMVRARVELDKTAGVLAVALERKRTLQWREVPQGWRRRLVNHVRGHVDRDHERDYLLRKHFGDYLSLSYRAIRGGQPDGGGGHWLSAAELAGHFLWVYFALHDRVRPYNGCLTWELAHHPLPGGALDRERLTDLLGRVVREAEPGAIRELFREVNRVVRARGDVEHVAPWNEKFCDVLTA